MPPNDIPCAITIRKSKHSPLGVQSSQVLGSAGNNDNADGFPAQLSAATRALPAGAALHLSVRTNNGLIVANLDSLGALVDRAAIGFGKLKNVGAKSSVELDDALRALRASLDEHGNLLREVFAQRRGFPVLPSGSGALATNWLQSVPVAAYAAIQACFTQTNEFGIFTRRYGILGFPRMTLREIGAALEITGERVRQLQSEMIAVLREAILSADYAGKPFVFRAEFCEPLIALKRSLDASVTRLWRESELFALIAKNLAVPESEIRPLTELIIDLLGLETRELKDCQRKERLERIIGPAGDGYMSIVSDIVDKIDRLLAGEPLGFDCFQLAAQLNRSWPNLCTPETVADWVHLCPKVEILEDGRFICPFAWLQSLEDKAFLVLLEAGKPLHFEQIAEEISRRQIERCREASLTTLKIKLCADKSRFLPVARSGLWKLTIWEHVDTRMIVEIAIEILRAEQTPMHADRIIQYVAERRPDVARNSIAAMMGEDPRLTRTGPATWGLEVWGKA
jgi:hypothetical protein